ncbi:MAG: hypothetical protein RDV41_07005 [Planctomycetota bacterium]|nr:hypothetical protein [Planctomycetota bacterium]
MNPLGVMAAESAAGQIDLGTMLIIFAVMMIIFVMLRAWSRVKRPVRTNESPQRGPARFASSMTGDDSRSSLEQAIVDLQDYSRDALAKLDTRARILERLIIDADRRIATLQQLVPPAPGGREIRDPAHASRPSEAGPAPTPAVRMEVSSLRSDPVSQARAAAPGAEPAETKPAAGADPMEQKRLNVWKLRAQGHSAAQIAADLNVPRGEVEFILAMRPEAGSGP